MYFLALLGQTIDSQFIRDAIVYEVPIALAT